MIKHWYPKNQPHNGVSLYGDYMDSIIHKVTATSDIVHVELGYNEAELLWKTHKLLRTSSRPKVVLTIHDPPVVVGKPFSKYLPSSPLPIKALRKALDILIGRRIITSVLKRADGLMVLNELAKPILTKAYNLEPEKIVVSHHPVYLKPVAASPKNSKSPTKLLFFGNISSRKGVDVLLRALRQIKVPLHVTIVGSAQGNERYLEQLLQLGAETPPTTHISFTGFASDAQLQVYVAQADIVVLPYLAEEIVHASGPLSSSLAAGKAIICSDIPIFHEVTHEQTGILFQPGNVERLQQCIMRLVEDKPLRDKLGKNAQEYSRQTTNPAALQADIERLYEVAT